MLIYVLGYMIIARQRKAKEGDNVFAHISVSMSGTKISCETCKKRSLNAWSLIQVRLMFENTKQATTQQILQTLT